MAREAAQGDAIFSLNDRIGLVHDAMALAKSGYATVSSALTVVDIFRNETECQCSCFCSRSICFTDLTGSLGLGQYRKKPGSLNIDVVGKRGDCPRSK